MPRGRRLGRLEHRKFNPFVSDGRREDLRNLGKRLVIWQGPNWNLCVLICKDFLLPGIDPLLANLRVRFIAIPALSRSTLEFEGPANALSAQSTVLIANAPTGPDRDPMVALILRPYRDRRLARRALSAKDATFLALLHEKLAISSESRNVDLKTELSKN